MRQPHSPLRLLSAPDKWPRSGRPRRFAGPGRLAARSIYCSRWRHVIRPLSAAVEGSGGGALSRTGASTWEMAPSSWAGPPAPPGSSWQSEGHLQQARGAPGRRCRAQPIHLRSRLQTAARAHRHDDVAEGAGARCARRGRRSARPGDVRCAATGSCVGLGEGDGVREPHRSEPAAPAHRPRRKSWAKTAPSAVSRLCSRLIAKAVSGAKEDVEHAAPVHTEPALPVPSRAEHEPSPTGCSRRSRETQRPSSTPGARRAQTVASCSTTRRFRVQGIGRCSLARRRGRLRDAITPARERGRPRGVKVGPVNRARAAGHPDRLHQSSRST